MRRASPFCSWAAVSSVHTAASEGSICLSERNLPILRARGIVDGRAAGAPALSCASAHRTHRHGCAREKPRVLTGLGVVQPSRLASNGTSAAVRVCLVCRGCRPAPSRLCNCASSITNVGDGILVIGDAHDVGRALQNTNMLRGRQVRLMDFTQSGVKSTTRMTSGAPQYLPL
jgi:hypothetical protein